MFQYIAIVYWILFTYADALSCTTSDDCSHANGNNFGDLRICEAGTCVECTSGDPDCPSTAPKCTNNVCVDCNWPVNCERFNGLPMCDKDDTSATVGQCITCVGRDSAWCGETRTDPLQNVCDPSTGKCVYCLQNTDCVDPTPICVTSNTCVPCADNSDCTDVTKSVCDTITGICGACSDDTGCEQFGTNFGDSRICDIVGGTCVECTSGDPHCPSTAPKCTNNVCEDCNWPVNCERFDRLPICDKDDTSATFGECVTCVGRDAVWCGDTRSDPLQNVCDSSTGKCVYCLQNTDCVDSTAPICDTTDNTCVPCDSNSVCCMDNSDCSQASAAECDISARTCVSCTSDSGCQHFGTNYGDLRICEAGTCVECRSGDPDCPSTAPKCTNNVCVDCKWPVNCERFDGLPMCDKDDTSATLGECVTCVGRDAAWCGDTRSDPLQNVCDPTTGKCVYCLQNTDCVDPTPICNTDDNTCGASTSTAACTDNSECLEATNSVCNTATETCESCIDDTGCEQFGTNFGDLRICDVDTGTCVECTSGDPHCPSTAPKCTDNVCEDCNWPVNCERFDRLPICDKDDTSASFGECVTCDGRDATWCGDTRTDPLQNVCDPSSGKCVYCLQNTDCADPTPICNTADNTCGASTAACTDNSDCTDVTKSVCDTTAGTCESCADDTGCEQFGTNYGDLRICDVDTGTCVECTSGDPHCPSTAPKCTNNVCEDCNWPANCERFDGLPICDKDDTSATFGECVTCDGRDATWCGDTRSDPLQNVCDASTGKCVYCLQNTDCVDSTAPICDTADHTCGASTAACTDNSECLDKTNSVCNAATGTCESCADDTDCERFDGLIVCDQDDTSATFGECIADDTAAPGSGVARFDVFGATILVIFVMLF